MVIDKETHKDMLETSMDKLERGYIIVAVLVFMCGFAIGGAVTSHLLYENVQSHYMTAIKIKDK